MLLIRMTTSLPRQGLNKGDKVYAHDVNAGELLSNEWCEIICPVSLEKHLIVPASSLSKTDTVLIIRPGGLGDLLLMTPALAVLSKICHVQIACWTHCAPALAGLPDIEVVAYPVPKGVIDGANHVINFENTIERDEQARETSMVDLWAERLGVFPESREVIYALDRGAVIEAAAWYQKNEMKRIGIQPLASARLRTYPGAQMRHVVDALLKQKFEVFVFGEPKSAPVDFKHHQFVNLTMDARVKTFAQSAALLATCDGFIGPDSALTHLAGALQVPTIGLYGPFPASLRVNYAASIRPVSGAAPCAPCFYHVRGGQQFPAGMPCNTHGTCLAMEAITPGRIVNKLLDWMELLASRRTRPALGSGTRLYETGLSRALPDG